jgi:nucleoside-diphosphate-sugar epimerase
MKVLFIGGTGNISTACTRQANEKGYEVYVLNRGKTTVSLPQGVNVIKADINTFG